MATAAMDLVRGLTSNVIDVSKNLLAKKIKIERESDDPFRPFSSRDLDQNFEVIIASCTDANKNANAPKPQLSREMGHIAMVLAGERASRINKDENEFSSQQTQNFFKNLETMFLLGMEKPAEESGGNLELAGDAAAGSRPNSAAAGGNNNNAAASQAQQKQLPKTIPTYFDNDTPTAIATRYFALAIRTYGEWAYRVSSQRVTYARHFIHHLAKCIDNWRPGEGHLTPAHAVFIEICLKTHNAYAASLRLAQPIWDVNPNLSGCSIFDYLDYYYYGGLCYAALQQWNESLDFLEQVMIIPAKGMSMRTVLSAKAYQLVSLIHTGEAEIPGAARNARQLAEVTREYGAFCETLNKAIQSRTYDANQTYNYPREAKEDGLEGLAHQCICSVPNHRARNVTQTYMTVKLPAIAAACGADDKFAMQRLRTMVQKKELTCTIDLAKGVVTFDDALSSAATSAEEAASTQATTAALRDVMHVNQLIQERQDLALLHPGHTLAMTPNLPQAVEEMRKELGSQGGGGLMGMLRGRP